MISDAFIHKYPSKPPMMPHLGPSTYFRYRFNPSGRVSEDGWPAGDGSWVDNDVSDVAGIYYAFQSKAKRSGALARRYTWHYEPAAKEWHYLKGNKGEAFNRNDKNGYAVLYVDKNRININFSEIQLFTEKELRTNYLVRQPRILIKDYQPFKSSNLLPA